MKIYILKPFTKYIVWGAGILALILFIVVGTISIGNSGDKYILESVKYVGSEPAAETASSIFGIFEELDGTQHKLYMSSMKKDELKIDNKYDVTYLMHHKAFPYDYIMDEAIPAGAKKVEDK